MLIPNYIHINRVCIDILSILILHFDLQPKSNSRQAVVGLDRCGVTSTVV